MKIYLPKRGGLAQHFAGDNNLGFESAHMNQMKFI